MVGESSGNVEGEDGVAALGGAILHDIFPLFLVIVFLGLGPRVARGEIDRAGIGGPGERMDFFLTLSQRDGFAAGGRDDVELAYFFVAVFVIVVGIGIRIFSGGGFALGEEGDPAAVGRPLGLGVVTGLGELDQRRSLGDAFFASSR